LAIEGSGPPLPGKKKMRMYAVGWDQSMDKPLKVVRRRILINID
jgi:ubiquinone biosynthesis protein Coq4